MKYDTVPGMTCCEMHKAAHIKLIAEMRTFFHLIERTPRNVLRYYAILKRRGLTAEMIGAGMSDVCPCQKGGNDG